MPPPTWSQAYSTPNYVVRTLGPCFIHHISIQPSFVRTAAVKNESSTSKLPTNHPSSWVNGLVQANKRARNHATSKLSFKFGIFPRDGARVPLAMVAAREFHIDRPPHTIKLLELRVTTKWHKHASNELRVQESSFTNWRHSSGQDMPHHYTASQTKDRDLILQSSNFTTCYRKIYSTPDSSLRRHVQISSGTHQTRQRSTGGGGGCSGRTPLTTSQGKKKKKCVTLYLLPLYTFRHRD